MRLVSRLFVFASSLFIILYGVLAGLFKVEGTFVASYVAGSNVLHGVDPVMLFHFPFLQKLIDMSGLSSRMMSFIGATPASIAADAVLAIPPAIIARILFTAASAAAFVMLVHATAKLAGTSNRTTYMVFLSSSFALASNFQASEPFVILALLLVLSFYGYSIGRVAACGALLGVAFPFNPLFAVPLVFFLLSSKWRAVTYFLATSLLMLIVTYAVVGHSTFAFYFQRIVPAYLDGRILNPFSDHFQTAWSFLRKVFLYNETLNAHPVLRSGSIYLFSISLFKAFVVVPSAYFFYKGISRGKPGESLAAATFPVVFLLPLFTPAELILLAPAIVVIVQSAVEENRTKAAGAFLVLYAIACIPFYSFEGEYMKFSNLLLNYECFLILVAIYILYIVFQSRIIPSHLRLFRLILTTAIMGAVTVTLYVGDRFVQHSAELPLRPVVADARMAGPAFSPGFRSGKMTYVAYDSSSETFTLSGVDIASLGSDNVFSYSSGRSGVNYAVETAREGLPTVCFKTRFAKAFFTGYGPRISGDEDYGAFIANGSIHVLDLDPRYVAPVDSLSFLPYKIIACSFNSERNYEIDFLLDSLNSSCALGRYNLFNRKLSISAMPFSPSQFCAVGDTTYVAQDLADSTTFWQLAGDTSPKRLFSVHGDIYDITALEKSIYISSDYRRGFENPTVYEYLTPQEVAVQRGRPDKAKR